jgi:transmembrane sensor
MFRDLSNYDIEDFAFDESFQQWVTKADSDHHGFWEQYLEEHPYQTDKILAARMLVLELTENKQNAADSGLVDAIWDNVRGRTETQPMRLWQRLVSWRVAASVTVILVGTVTAFWLRQFNQDASSLPVSAISSERKMVEKVNSEDKIVEIKLEDGSVVRLSRNSRLTFPEHFDTTERIVYLEGEAFFDVRKNPKSPFLIFANKTVTKVIGTSFKITAYDNEPKVVVAVQTGKVSVFERGDFEKNRQNPQIAGVVLNANQKVEFSKDGQKFNKTLVEKPHLLEAAVTADFDFDNTPLAAVFAKLETAYGVEIIYDNELVSNRSLKVSLADESLFEKLDVICQTMGMSYQTVDAKIIIEKKNP